MKTTRTILLSVGILGLMAGIYLLCIGEEANGLLGTIGSGCLVYWVYGVGKEVDKKN